ncbi:hypothetical protein BH09BAC3_BH09BAC3_07970 [soil metagenome]
MKVAFFTPIMAFLFHLSTQCVAQSAWDNSLLEYGKYPVGFKNYQKKDETRTYHRLFDWTGEVVARPMSISMWYPSDKINLRLVAKVKNYMAVLKNEEEWECLPDNRILSWFYYSDSKEHRKQMQIQTKAYFNAEPVKKKFPVVIYAPSYQASSIENFVLCEFLASHGYLVLSSPSRGSNQRFLSGGTTMDIETQARDIEFIIGELSSLPFADTENVAVVGFSFGGMSNILAQMKNDRIKALVCLDGSVKYQLNRLMLASDADIAKVDVPVLFMSQKDIPLNVLVEDNIDSLLNTRFEFYDSLKFSEAWHLKFNNLTHSYFSSMGIFFQDRDMRQDKSEKEIALSYKWVCDYTLQFLNAFLKKDGNSKQFLENEPMKNGVPSNYISFHSKKPGKKILTFEEFNNKASKQGYDHLLKLYDSLKSKESVSNLMEWKFNNLGLQLLFRGKLKEGLNVLDLATNIFPTSANAFDSLAEGYLILGNKALAITNFKLSLERDSQNQNAIDRLLELDK